MHVPLEVIKDKFSFFGRIMDIEENPRAGIKRSVFITFFEREAVQMTLTTKSLVLIGENLKVMAWMVFGAPDQNAEILVRVEELLEVPLGVPLEAEAVMEPVPTATRPAFV